MRPLWCILFALITTCINVTARTCPGIVPLICNNQDPISRITASSSWNRGLDHSPSQSCLDNFRTQQQIGAWVAGANDNLQWIQADFGSLVLINSIVTQGGPDANQWVTDYKLHCSNDSMEWTTLRNENGEDTFGGNTDQSTKVIHHIDHVARYFKLQPTSWNGLIILRWEVYGCAIESQTINCEGLCQNNGVCVTQYDAGSCDCRGTGYTGAYCDIDIDECQRTQNPCQKDSSCKNLRGSFTCESEATPSLNITVLAMVVLSGVTALSLIALIITIVYTIKTRDARKPAKEKRSHWKAEAGENMNAFDQNMGHNSRHRAYDEIPANKKHPKELHYP